MNQKLSAVALLWRDKSAVPSTPRLLRASAFILILCASNLVAGPMHEAVSKGDITKVREIIAQDPSSVNEKREKTSQFDLFFNAWTPLQIAAWTGRVDIASNLIQAGADLDAQKYFDDYCKMKTALGIAVHQRHGAMAKLLLQNRARYDLEITVLRQPLDLLEKAAFTGETVIIDALLEAGHPVRSDALHEAADWGDPLLVQKLIAARAPVNVVRLGKCERNRKWYPAVFPLLVDAAPWISDQEEEVIKTNINKNEVWTSEQKEEMVRRLSSLNPNDRNLK